MFGIVNIPEYYCFKKDKNLSVSSYAKPMDNNVDKINYCLKDPLYETVPSEISLKIINQKGKERKYRLNIRQKMKK